MKKFLSYILCSLCSLSSWGQTEFTQLNWDELRIDSVLPVYSEVVPLETDYRLYDYAVQVRFGEYAPLTEQETAVVQCFAAQVADSLCVETHVGVSRGQGMMDISFVPIVSRNGRYKKLLSAKIEIVAVPKAVSLGRVKAVANHVRRADQSAARWASKSVLAEGRWVKISVQNDGIYHLTYSALSGMGFADPSRCRVYGYGGHQQPEALDADTDFDDLEEVSLWKVPDGYLFYANGLTTHRNNKCVTNSYAREACYFVTEAATPVGDFPTESESVSPTTTVTTIQAYASYNPQRYAWFQGGCQLFEDYDFYNGSNRSYTLSLPCTPAGGGRLTVSFSAANDASTQMTTSMNGTSLGTMTLAALGEYQYAVVGERTYQVSSLGTANSITLSATSGRHARLNYLTLAYTGQLAIDAAHRVVAFSHQPSAAAEALQLQYTSGQQPQIWRLAERGSKTISLQGASSTSGGQSLYTVTVENDGAAHQYVAFDAAAYGAYPQPAVVGAIGNQNLHAWADLDMVIITPASGIFDAQAERLAAAHREVEGLRVGVVRADLIYNEFSSGTPDATAYRRFMKMLYDRAAEEKDKPRYLLLFGDCAWDNRMLSSAWSNKSPNDFLLCYESENSVSDVRCYIMEDYFGLLDDGEGANLLRDKTDLGIGRFPVQNQSQAEALVNKTIAYLRGDNAGAWKNIISFLGDDGDKNEHLEYADDVAKQVERDYPQLEVRKVMWDAYKREVTAAGNRYPQVKKVVERQLNEGALMINYTGHGATYCLSHERVLQMEDFANYSSPRMPLWFTAACDVMPIDTQKDNIGETAILNPNGAAVGFIGTTRTVYAHKNLELNRYFCQYLFTTDELNRPNRVGDALRLAKSRLAGSESGYLENKLHYVLAGDPALTFGSVKNKVQLTSINGIAIEDLPDDFMLHAGSKPRLAGIVTNDDGEELTDFNGILSVRLYDSQSTITCLNNDRSASEPFTYKAYDKILYNAQDSVRKGHFDLICPIPVDIHYSNEAGRLLFYAVGSDHRTEARGYSTDFLLGGTEPGLVYGSGPDILAYLNDEGFENGFTVNASPYFIAQLHDTDGINNSGNGLGHDLELVIDDDPTLTYNLNDYYVNAFGDFTRGHLAYSIPTLSEGTHTLRFRAWDMLNNPSAVTLNFEVDRSLKPSIVKLTTSMNPARTYTQFLLNYNRPGSTCQFTIDVFDFMGRLLWSHTEKGSNDSGFYAIPWDLTTGGGASLNSGIYLYRARVSCDDSEEATETQKLIINRRQ